ncbi:MULTISPECIES: hypothetical protein [Sphingobacterium]|uniref:hypothetical protein n=1 Tax=Sphingobacterium TaxID=28453 RepID=UPI00104D339C|nr:MULTISPECIES: hypothetical protein [Sphingobacterium]MCW2263737.1 hypothetical protein [Sphingobacterium kitahiroshimense]TCR03787.1 hypothetical protein EDF67_1115 [Sphingobacterium sp. JUb78]
MTLKEFKNSFPEIYRQYESNSFSENMQMKPIDRILNFIESAYGFNLINIVHEAKNLYLPMIKYDGKDKGYNIWLSLTSSKSLLIGKAFEFISTGKIH